MKGKTIEGLMDALSEMQNLTAMDSILQPKQQAYIKLVGGARLTGWELSFDASGFRPPRNPGMGSGPSGKHMSLLIKRLSSLPWILKCWR